MPRGGARSGAGRPEESLVTVCLYIEKETRDELSGLSSDLGISRGKVVDLLVRWYSEDCRKDAGLREFSDRTGNAPAAP